MPVFSIHCDFGAMTAGDRAIVAITVVASRRGAYVNSAAVTGLQSEDGGNFTLAQTIVR
jgi:hypothetical protein